MNKTIYKFTVSAFFIAIIFAGAPQVKASTLFIDGPEVFPTRHESVVNVFLQTQFDEVNAVEGKIVFPEHVTPKSIWSGGSTVSLWVETPKIEGKEVSFSGVVPGGISPGEEVRLFQVIFVGDSEGTGEAVFKDTRVLLNDGLGTQADVVTVPSMMVVSSGAEVYAVPKDTLPPENFYITISRDDGVFGGRYFAVFRTHDKESGVDYYEVQENKSGEIDESLWHQVESPYELIDQKQGSYIFVKAVDNNGNITVATHEPRKFTPLQLYAIYVIIPLIVLYVWYRYGRKKRRQNKIS